MKNRSKRYLALLLSVLMAFSTFGFTSFALDAEPQDEGEKAVAAQAAAEEPAKEEPAKEVQAKEEPAAEEPAPAESSDAPAAVEEEKVGEAVEGTTKEAAAAPDAKNADKEDEPEAGVEAPGDIPPVIAKGWTYDGTEKNLVTRKNSAKLFALGNSPTNAPGNDSFSGTVPAVSDAGVYFVWFKYRSNGSRHYLGAVTVKPADFREFTVTMDDFQYGNPGEPKVEGLPEAVASQVRFTYTYGMTRIDDLSTADARRGYVVTAVLPASKNYIGGVATDRFNITRAMNRVTVSIDSWTYGAEPKTPVAEALYGTEDIHFMYSDLAMRNFFEEVPTDVGAYYVWAIVDGTANYTGARASALFRITPKTIYVRWGQDEFTYDGTEKNMETWLEGVLDADKDDVEVVYSDDYTNKATDAGEYVAGVCGIKGARAFNYMLIVDQGIPVSVWYIASHNWKINKAELVIRAMDQTIDYGDAKPALDPVKENVNVKVEGKPEKGDAVELAGITLSTDYEKNYKHGTYKIALAFDSGAFEEANPNYTAKVADGNLIVNPKVTLIVAKAAPKGSKKAVLSWNSITNAASYDVYFSRCNHDGKVGKPKKVATVKGLSYTKKGLKKGKCYKYYVVAKDAKGNVISKSRTGHVVAGKYNEKNTNAKTLTANVTSVTLTKGATYKVSAKQTKAKKGKALLDGAHAVLLRYRSENRAVATISANGTITAVGKGWCRVYVQSVDGIWQLIEVTVK